MEKMKALRKKERFFLTNLQREFTWERKYNSNGKPELTSEESKYTIIEEFIGNRSNKGKRIIKVYIRNNFVVANPKFTHKHFQKRI